MKSLAPVQDADNFLWCTGAVAHDGDTQFGQLLQMALAQDGNLGVATCVRPYSPGFPGRELWNQFTTGGRS